MQREPRSKAQAVTKSQIRWLFVSMTAVNGILALFFSLANGRGPSQAETNAVASAAGVLVGLGVYYAIGRPGRPSGTFSICIIPAMVIQWNADLDRAVVIATAYGLLSGTIGAVVDRVVGRALGTNERPRLRAGEAAMYDAEIDQASLGPGVERPL